VPPIHLGEDNSYCYGSGFATVSTIFAKGVELTSAVKAVAVLVEKAFAGLRVVMERLEEDAAVTVCIASTWA